ncbi:SDR family NAD(P)-dependent oxidoreductase [Streptomyces sp. NPDC048282]|uniref:SDR family NAD(P)-dependent oxidoreductase n=1 Tax=Streptomyces sp. NPDC048282 TaxID=3365528 RepID=UPI0037174C00
MTADANTGLSLAGRVAIVTGAGQGLGRDITLAVARAGAQVAVVDLNPETAQKVAAELGEHGKAGIAITCDVSRRKEVRATVERTMSEWGGIDITHYFLQESYENLKARGGRIVNLGSGAGVSGRQEHFSYAATKEAIRATTRVVARKRGPEGIRVNTICPAAYDTPAMKRFLSNANDEQTAAMTAQIPLARFGSGDEVASVAVFLASDASSCMTGHTLMVDGGATMDAGR